MQAMRTRAVVAMSAYLLAAALVTFGVLVNPHTWSAWWVRNGDWLFNCSGGWSVAAKIAPAVLVGIGFLSASQVPAPSGRVLRWTALPLLLAIGVAAVVTWPAEGCPPV